MATNLQLIDASISKALLLERHKKYVVMQVQRMTRTYVANLIKRLGPKIVKTKFSILDMRSIRSLTKAFTTLERAARPGFRAELISILENFATQEAALQAIVWATLAEKPTQEVVLPSASWRKKDESLGYGGDSLVDALLSQVSNQFRRTVGQAMLTNADSEQAEKLFLSIGSKLEPYVTSSVSTVMQLISAVAFLSTAGLYFDRYVYLAIIDKATSDICRYLNLKIFRFRRGPLPPQHPRCRSNTAPLNDDKYEFADTLPVWLSRQANADRYRSDVPLTFNQYRKEVLS